MPYLLRRKKYYKYNDVNWTQPVLTANGTMGGSSFACTQSDYYTENDGRKQEAWRMFSSSNTEEWQINDVSKSKTYWASWYNPKPLKITKLQVVNAANTDSQYSPATLVLEGSNDNSSWTTLGTTNNSNVTANSTWDATISSTGWYKYYRIVVTPRSISAVMVNKLKITALERNVINGTASDYSYIENQNYVLKTHTPWTQPVLTSDTSHGTLTTSGYSGSNQAPWRAFDGIIGGTNKYFANSASSAYIDWHTPEPIKISSCKIYTTTETGYLNRFPQTIKIYGSDTGSSWVQIGSLSGYSAPASGGSVTVNCNATKAYAHTKFEFGPVFSGAVGNIAVAEIVITASVGSNNYSLNRSKENVIYDSWVQPTLTANGTLGGTSFAVSATKAGSSRPAYYAVDGNSSTYWQIEGNATGNSFTFYNPVKLKVSSLVFTFYNNTEEYAIRSGVLYGSNDNSAWTQIKSFSSYTTTWDVSSNTNAYKYHKISITKGGSYNDYVDLNNLKINATALIEK